MLSVDQSTTGVERQGVVMLTVDQHARAQAVQRFVLSDAALRAGKHANAYFDLFAIFNPFLFWVRYVAK